MDGFLFEVKGKVEMAEAGTVDLKAGTLHQVRQQEARPRKFGTPPSFHLKKNFIVQERAADELQRPTTS